MIAVTRLFLRLGLCAACALAPAMAAVPEPLRDGAYGYEAADMSLGKVLGDFTDNYGLSLSLAPGLANLQVRGRQQAASGVDFLDRLALRYKLQWFVYGGRLYVSALDDFASERLDVGVDTITTLKPALTGMGALESKFGWGELPDEGAVLVSGPTEYVRLIRKLATGHDKPADNDALVFRLRYASVEDREVSYRDRKVVTPGAANILRTIIGERNESTAKATSPMLSGGLGQTENRAGTMGGQGAPVSTVSKSRIAADPRLNAVIIRDAPGKRDFYRKLIEEIDQPQRLVEIEALILDIDRDKLKDLGAEFTIAGRHGRYDFKSDKDERNSNLLVNNFDRFYVRLRALEQRGDAQVQARPAVITQDNMMAVLDLSKTAYLRVVGERVAEAKEITAGTMLRVTPRLIGEGRRSRIQLFVDIEDGSVEGAATDHPTVQRSTISTQALIDDAQTLVIGGYRVDRDEHKESKVPLLGDVPLLGGLFTSRQAERSRRERLFILTPRRIDTDRPGALAERADALPSNLPLHDRTAPDEELRFGNYRPLPSPELGTGGPAGDRPALDSGPVSTGP